LSHLDDALLAHAGAGGEIFDPAQKAVYFSPRRFEFIARLSPAAQVEFWQHALPHLDQPRTTASALLNRFPPRLVRGENASLLTEGVSPDWAGAFEQLESLEQHAWNHPAPNRPVRTLIRSLLSPSSTATLQTIPTFQPDAPNFGTWLKKL